MSKEIWEIEEKYGLFKVQEHVSLHTEPSLCDDITRGYKLSALECVETASNTNELRSWLEENKTNYHNCRFVVMPIFDVEFKINFEE